MTTDQLKNVILEAVDCLRLRKCRPDRESIAVYVMRKLGSSMNEIFSEIENTVDQGLLLKVEYKSSISYRSPKNFDLKNSPLLTKHSKILNSSKTTRYVISGMNELLSTFPIYSQIGVPYGELKKRLQEFDKERFAEEAIKEIFEREEGAGSIQVAQSDDPLDSVRIFPKDIKVPEDMKLISLSEDVNASTENKKKKRPKKEESCGTSKSPTKKGKQALVYAVKSDPHKFKETSLEDEEAVKAKVEQISSIGLKVISEKGAAKKTPVKPKTKNVGTVQRVNKVANEVEKKPSLTLVKVEGEQELNGATETKTAEVKEKQTPTSKPKIGGKRRIDGVQKTTKPTKPKKVKLDTSISDSVDSVNLTCIPPRYTYGSKKRLKDDDYEDIDGSFEKLTKKNADECMIEEQSNGQLGECAYCKQQKGTAEDSEDFLLCGTCNAKVHTTCIAYSEDHAKRLRMNMESKDLQWQCFSCKLCGVCKKALMSSKIGSEFKKTKGKISKKNEQQRYILCDHCDRGYHVKCINASLPVSESSWYCGECNSQKVESANNDTPVNLKEKNGVAKKSKALTKKPPKAVTSKKKVVDQSNAMNEKALTQVKSQNGGSSETSSTPRSATLSSSNSKSQEEIPDISTWTPVQVQKYFTEKGLQDEAASLRDQEIDGMSLLLLRRADVIFGLKRLGPALKIYRLVCQLQQHSSALKKKQSSSENASKQNK